MKQQSTISEMAFRAFLRTSGIVRNKMEPYFARHGISGAQWGVLRALQRAEGEGVKGLRLGDLGKRLLVRPPSVTTLVDRLERDGLVDRRAEEGDQRAKVVSLSKAGRALVGRVLVGHSEYIAGMLGGLNEDEQRVMGWLMERMGRHLEGPERRSEGATERRRGRAEVGGEAGMMRRLLKVKGNEE